MKPAEWMLGAVLAVRAVAAHASPPDPSVLARAYPDAIASVDAHSVHWRDGTTMPLSDGDTAKSFERTLHAGSIVDMLATPYEAGPPAGDPVTDPGRVRNFAFFGKMYGDCRRHEVEPHLVTVTWLPHSWGHAIRATAVNGVASHLEEVSREIDAMPADIRRYAFPIGGTYNCRAVADTGEPSLHGMGAAIDINVAQSDYWLWRKGAPYRNRIPEPIVAAFERHGFIWGGKWSHYDTMHFEYRPELLPAPGPG